MNRENQIPMFKPNVEDFWNLEIIGINPKIKVKDITNMDWSKVAVSRKDKRYIVSWHGEKKINLTFPKILKCHLED